MQACRVIGIGNPMRGDDAAGPRVIEILRLLSPQLDTRIHHGDGTRLIDMWEGARAAILVDAVSSGEVPGTIHRFEGSDPLPRDWFGASTHLFNVAEAVELARVLKRLPPGLVLYGITGSRFETGVPISPEVEEAARRLARRLADELAPGTVLV